MRELHLKLRTLSLDNATCPDSERYPFLQEIIKLDKKLHENWYTYDHFIPGTQVTVEEPVLEEEDSVASEATSEEPETSVNPNEEAVNPNELTEKSEQPAPAEEPAPAEAKPKKAKATAKRTTKKAAKK